jgi:hypothetical protein
LRGKPPSKPTLADRFAAERAAAKRAALNAVKRARRTADKLGVDLSDWEGEFLGSVEDRVKTYGRAFADPEKGARGQALSTMQTRKLKEIAAKAAGDDRKPWEKKAEKAKKNPLPSRGGKGRGWG